MLAFWLDPIMTTASQGEGGLPINIRPFLGSVTPILGYRVGQTGKSEILMLGPIPKSQYPSRWLGRKVGMVPQKSLILA